ncbi:MAG TPA: type II 3-dehydroquinate dehydratase [Dehalococcoidia bacterium]|jgi:3-dehydroquinate dehydratase-2|nr:type II 3-dehydroquinate dehydratase [Dehalococcoidia bacterium]
MKILVINGPNLNMLGRRQVTIYGPQTLEDIGNLLQKRAGELGVEVTFYQSNSEGDIIDFIQREAPSAQGIIINPGALTHYSFSLRDALATFDLPVIEVHLSNIYAREEWRARSVIAPAVKGQISGLGWRGYMAALDVLAAELAPETGR